MSDEQDSADFIEKLVKQNGAFAKALQQYQAKQEAPRDRCRYCSKLIRYKVNARPRKYCNDACRQRAYRLRALLKEAPEGTELQLRVWQEVWTEAQYPDVLIEQLTKIWRAYGHDAIMQVQAALVIHGEWKVEQTAHLLTVRMAEAVKT
jgi:hypothetical protein